VPQESEHISEERRKLYRKKNPIRQLIDDWFDRLVGAVGEGSLSAQDEEYESGRTSRDFIWNTVGFTAWGMVFPLLTIVVTQLAGVDAAGRFSLAFVAANLLYIIGNYGMRTYQISDLDEYHSFADYQVSRALTCIVMLIVGFVFFSVRPNADEMIAMGMGVCAYKAIDALGDVYEGRLQQVDKLYLAGISLALRSFVAFIAFTLLLLITGNLAVASIAMAIGAAITFGFVTFPLTLFETPKSQHFNVRSVWLLLKDCAPVFAALFLYSLVDNLPKFLIDGVLPYEDQLYFNALYFPAMAILLIAGFVYKPMLVRMANLWADESRRNRFDILIVVMLGIIVVLTLAFAALMAWVGIPLMSFLYGVDFSQFMDLCYIMIAAGGVTAAIDFLYQVITVLRRQNVVLGLYLITFVLSLLVLTLMINMVQLKGAVIGYLIVMCILLVLLAREYITQRIGLGRGTRSR